MHIVSNVEGELEREMDAIDVLRATFPAGTLTGAPKVRAMEIIDDWSRPSAASTAAPAATSAIAARWTWRSRSAPACSRTACCTCRRRPASSPTRCPRSEWQETEDKARAVLRAAELVQDGLDGEI